jgi:hypothetical protein
LRGLTLRLSNAFDNGGAKAAPCLDREIANGGMAGERQGGVEEGDLGRGVGLEGTLVGGAGKERGGVRGSGGWRGEL